MPDIHREQISVKDQRGRGNEVVSVDESAVRPPVLPCQRAGGVHDVLIDRNPGDCRAEELHAVQFSIAGSGQQFEANDLAGNEWLVIVDDVTEKVGSRLYAA
jgi:hypothetical protein